MELKTHNVYKVEYHQRTQGNLMERSSSDYIYADNGKPIINQTGSASRMEHTKELVRSNVTNQCYWKAGLNNSITYKNLNLSFILHARCFLLTRMVSYNRNV
jgi:hypothetical protein